MKLVFCILLSTIILGCDDLSSLSEPTLVYGIESEDVSDSDIIIVAKRFSEFPNSMFSKVTYDLNRKEILFSNGVPDEGVLNYLSTNRGEFVIGGESEFDKWILNKHISDVGIKEEAEQIYLLMRLTEEGGDILLEKSRNKLGRLVVMKVDGETIMQAQITGPIGMNFKVTTGGKSLEEVKKLAALIRYGSISQSLVLKRRANKIDS